MNNAMVFLVINQHGGGEMAIEQQQIEKILIYGRERVLESVAYQCVSRHGASLDTGKDINAEVVLCELFIGLDGSQPRSNSPPILEIARCISSPMPVERRNYKVLASNPLRSLPGYHHLIDAQYMDLGFE